MGKNEEAPSRQPTEDKGVVAGLTLLGRAQTGDHFQHINEKQWETAASFAGLSDVKQPHDFNQRFPLFLF